MKQRSRRQDLRWNDVCVALGVIFFVAFSCALPSPSFSGDAEQPFAAMNALLTKYQDSTYTLTMQNRIRGQMLPEETIAVKTARGGSIYMKWIGTRYKGRELICKSGWNSDRAWVKEGGTLSFCAVSVGLLDPLITDEYLRPITFFGLDSLAKEAGDWKENGTALMKDNGQIVIERREGKGTVVVRFSPKGFLEKAEIIDSSGKKMETWTLADIHMNVGLSEKDFEPDNPEYGFPGYSEQGIYIDPEMLKTNLDRSWADIRDYTCTLIKQERINGTLQQKNTILLKFRKPCDLYLQWLKEPHKGRQLLYCQRIDDKMLVRESGILGISPVRLSLDSWVTKGDTNHRITDLDIGYVIKMIHDNLYKALTHNDVRLRYLGTSIIGGRRAYMVESWLASQETNKYYAAHSLVGHDQITGLPIKFVNYDENEQVFEDLEWSDLKFNIGLTDKDFDPQNPNYNF